MGLTEGLKKSLQSWLDIKPADRQNISIDEKYDFNLNAGINRVWMRGRPEELSELYKQLTDESGSKQATFWGAVPQSPIHKIHMGLPKMTVKTLSNIVVRDLNGIKLDKRQDEWDEIASEHNLKKLFKEAVSQALYVGDGAFKISFDSEVSDLPIIEFIPGDKIELVQKRGRLTEIIFKTVKVQPKTTQKYLLKEHYGMGYVRYELFRMNGSTLDKVDLLELEETKNLEDVGFGGYSENGKGCYMMAVPFSIFESSTYEGRGESIFDAKRDCYDALDEIVSQWADAVRTGRTKTYIPEALVPKGPSGMDIPPNPFDDRYIKTGNDLNETGKNQITVSQPTIPSENYLQSYITYLDLCLQGIISPSTLGIDTKKLDNAEAQREKEKTTLYTRNIIVESLVETIQKLVKVVLMTKDSIHSVGDTKMLDIDVTVEFGEYANPSFEAVVETVAKAKTAGVMSTRTSLDEMYGDDKTDEWKDEEAKRIAEEQGVSTVEEPDIPGDYPGLVS